MLKHRIEVDYARYVRFASLVQTLATLFVALALGVTPAQAAETYPVNIGTQIWPGSVPIYVAIAKGFTDKNGIDIKKVIVSSGGNRRSALLAGEIQFAEFAFSNVAVAADRGAPIKYVMSTHDFETFSLIVRSALKNQVKSVADLRGKTVGFTTPGAGAWAWARIYLLKAGLSPERDVNLVGGMSEAGVILTALKTGKIDAYPSWEPITTTALSDGIGFALIPIWEPKMHEQWVGSTALGSGLSTTGSIIRDKPGMVRAMVAAIKEGLNYINSTSPKDIANLLVQNPKTREHWAQFKPEILVDMLDKSKAVFAATNGSISKSGVEDELAVAQKAGIIKKKLTLESVADTQFAGTKP